MTPAVIISFIVAMFSLVVTMYIRVPVGPSLLISCCTGALVLVLIYQYDLEFEEIEKEV